MRTRTTLALALLLGLTTMAGCIGEDTTEPGELPAPTSGSSATEAEQGEGSEASLPTYIPLIRIDHPPEAFEADVACTFGGGPQLPRKAAGYVANGTTHLAVMLTNPQTSAGHLQVGYALDAKGDDETDAADAITWLDPVAPGETANRSVEAGPDLIETSSDDRRWDFYKRYTTPEAQEETCYTGIKVGSDRVHIDAVRGPT